MRTITDMASNDLYNDKKKPLVEIIVYSHDGFKADSGFQNEQQFRFFADEDQVREYSEVFAKLADRMAERDFEQNLVETEAVS